MGACSNRSTKTRRPGNESRGQCGGSNIPSGARLPRILWIHPSCRRGEGAQAAALRDRCRTAHRPRCRKDDLRRPGSDGPRRLSRGGAPLEYYLSASKPGRYPRKPLGKLQLQTISREIAWAVSGKSASLKQEALRNGQNGSPEAGLGRVSSLK